MDNEKLSISLIMLFAFSIVFTAIYYVDETTDLEIQSTTLTDNNSTSKKIKVVILGSSRAMPLDAEFIDEYVLKNGKKVDVYNHALSTDKPSRRLSILEKSIAEKPDLVLIGLDAAHYLEPITSQSSNSNFQSKFYGCSIKLPEIQDFYSIMPINKEILGIDLNNFDNPKLSTLKLINKFSIPGELKDIFGDYTLKKSKELHQLSEIKENKQDSIKTALVSFSGKQSENFDKDFFRKIADKEKIDKIIKEKGSIDRYSQPFNPNGSQANALREIIKILKNEDIEVSIFSTPIHKKLFKVASYCSINNFESFMENLSTQFGISHYNLHDLYLNEDIWRDSIHIVHGDQGIDYSRQIALAIQHEV